MPCKINEWGFVHLYHKEMAESEECSPKPILSIKGRRCNQTLLVHQDMKKKTTFYEKN